jgi:Protein of unknown function (DUF3309)
MSLSNLAIIVLFFALVAVLPNWPYSRSWGWIPAGIVALVFALLIYLASQGTI